MLLTSDERCTYSSSLTPSFINETSPKAKMLNLPVSKISCEDMINLKNVDLLSTMTMLQILPRVLPPLLLLLLFEVGEFPLRSLSSHTGPLPKTFFIVGNYHSVLPAQLRKSHFHVFLHSRKCSVAQFL